MEQIMTPEGENVAYLKKKVKALGGHVRKLSYEGRAGAPDLLVLLNGEHFLIEMKAPGKHPSIIQLKEIALLNSYNFVVYVLDSKQAIDEVLNSYVH